MSGDPSLYQQACCCALSECLERGCIRQRSAIPGLGAPPMPFGPPALGYRYRIAPDGTIFYEQDPSFSLGLATTRAAA
jgi:hypothetical protein